MRTGDKIKLGTREWEITCVRHHGKGGQGVVGLKVDRPTFDANGNPLDDMYVPMEIINHVTLDWPMPGDNPLWWIWHANGNFSKSCRHPKHYDHINSCGPDCYHGRYEVRTVDPRAKPVDAFSGDQYGASPAEEALAIFKEWKEGKAKPTAPDILKAAATHMEDRAKLYDKPEGERSMPPTVAAFNAVTGHNLTEEQGWLFMELLKCVRAEHNGYRSDNYEDGAAYVALKGEAAARSRAK